MREIAEQAKVEIIERDYARKPLTPDEVEGILGDGDIAAMLNSRHAIYKERGFAGKLPARKELITLIVAEPNLLRRPIARKGRTTVIGFDKVALDAIVSGK